MIAEGQIRVRLGSLQGYSPLAFTPNGEVIITPGHSEYIEPARLARMHTVCTGASGVAPGTALSPTPPMTLYNPANSGIVAAITKATLGYVSGTLGAGTIVWGVNNNPLQAAPTGGSELTPICTLLGSPRSVCRAYQGSTLAAAPTIFR